MPLRHIIYYNGMSVDILVCLFRANEMFEVKMPGDFSLSVVFSSNVRQDLQRSSLDVSCFVYFYSETTLYF